MWHLPIDLVHQKCWNMFAKWYHYLPMVFRKWFNNCTRNMLMRGNLWCHPMYSYSILGYFLSIILGPGNKACDTPQVINIEVCWKIRWIHLWRLVNFLLAKALLFHWNIVVKANFLPKHFIFGFESGGFNMGFNGTVKLHHETLRTTEPKPLDLVYSGICFWFSRFVSLFWTETDCWWIFHW